MLNLDGTHIGGWCNLGCVFKLARVAPPYPPNCIALWRGYMQIVQGGSPYYGQKTPLEIIFNGTTYFFSRDCGPGVIQTSTMNSPSAVVLAGTAYIEIRGTSSGPGTDGAGCELRVLS